MGSETDEIIGERFKSFSQKYQEQIEESMTGSKFSFDSVYALYYNLNKIRLSRDRSYIDSTIKPKNNDDK